MTYSNWLLVYNKAKPTCSIKPDLSDHACIEIFALLTCRKVSPDKTIRLTSRMGTLAREKIVFWWNPM